MERTARITRFRPALVPGSPAVPAGAFGADGPAGSCEIWTSARPTDACADGPTFDDGFESGDTQARS